MMTFDKIYQQSAPTQPVVEELPANTKGPAVFVLHESGLGSRALGQGSTYNEMYANAALSLGMPEAEVRKAGYKFSVEHQEILSGVRGLEATLPEAVDFGGQPSSAPAQTLSKRQAAMAKARAVRMANLAARKTGKV